MHDRVTVDEAWITWAIAEVGASRLEHWCPGDKITALRNKVRGGATSIDQFDNAEQQTLRTWIGNTRERYIGSYMTDVDYFVLEAWSPDKLKAVLCMSQMDPEERGKFLTFEQYMQHQLSSKDPRHSRNAATSESYCPSRSAPIIAGLHKGRTILIDGYHRAIFYLNSCSTDPIKILVPRPR